MLPSSVGVDGTKLRNATSFYDEAISSLSQNASDLLALASVLNFEQIATFRAAVCVPNCFFMVFHFLFLSLYKSGCE